MRVKLSLFCVTAIFVLSSNEAARILTIFPVPSISHQVVFRPLTQALAKLGHDVIVITPDPAFAKGETPRNLTEIDVHDVSYDVVNKCKELISKGQNEFITQMKIILEVIIGCVDEYSNIESIQSLKNKEFDLLLIEAVSRPALVFSHIFKVPVILISSFGAMYDNFDVVGAPTHPILYPSIMSRRINNLSLMEKVATLYYHFFSEIVLRKQEKYENIVLKKTYGDNTPTIKELTNNVDMLFLNVHPIFQGIRPVPPNVLYIGGILEKPKEDLPRDLKSYLDSSKNGVIYVSFGTNVYPSMLHPQVIQTFLKVLSELPYNVLFKYDKDELPGKPDNMRIAKWFPQSDVLRHPNVKLFITQGGLQSTDEALAAGVPLIAFPMLIDQWFNAERYEYHKIGIKLDIENVDYNVLKNAITNIIRDESYRRNIRHLYKLIQDQPMKPLDQAVWWVEYVLRHRGAKHLKSPAANITWTEYLELELMLTVLGAILLSTILFVVLLLYVFKKLANYSLIITSKEKQC